MSHAVLKLIQSPEFWMTVAFCAVVFLAARPLSRFLKEWGQKQAAHIKNQIDETAALKKQAQDLLEKYENHTRDQEREAAVLLEEAEKEIDYLKEAADRDLQEKLENKAEAVELRLKAVWENSERLIRARLLEKTIEKTKKIISEKEESVSDTQAALTMIFKALDEKADTLKKEH